MSPSDPTTHLPAGEKLGRNDPCPSGAGIKFKKCLLAHPELRSASTLAVIWWACDRWQASMPPDTELVIALAGARQPGRDKLELLAQRLLASLPETVDWELVLTRFAGARYPDLPGLLVRITDRIGEGDINRLVRVCDAAVALAEELGAEALSSVVATYCRVADRLTDPRPVQRLFDALQARDQDAECQTLRTRFPEWLASAARPPASPDRKSVLETEKSGRSAGGRDTSAEAQRADELWAGFMRLQAPSVEQMDAFVSGLLTLPADQAEWNSVLDELDRRRHPDLPGIYRRVAAAVTPVESEMAFFHWAAAEIFLRHGHDVLLPEVAAGFGRLGGETYEVDALCHVLDLLMSRGHAASALELSERFLPIVEEDNEVLPTGEQKLAWHIFGLRIGEQLTSADPITPPLDLLAPMLLQGLADYFSPEASQLAARIITGAVPEPAWSRSHFEAMAARDASEQEQADAAQTYLATQLWLMRDAWLHQQLPPSVTWLGLSGVWRMIGMEGDERRKVSTNVLDYLVPSRLEGRIARACRELIGINEAQAEGVVRTLEAYCLFAAQRGLIPAPIAATTRNELMRLRRKLAKP